MTEPLSILDDSLMAVLESISGGIYPPGRRTQLQVAYCHLVIDHQKAIGCLVELRAYASAMALARPTFEALVKGLWLYYCATDEQLELHAEGKELIELNVLISQLGDKDIPANFVNALANVKTKYWKALCSFAHVGHTQLRHWINPTTGVEPNYPEKAVMELANFASFMVLVAGRELTLRAGNQAGSARLLDILPVD